MNSIIQFIKRTVNDSRIPTPPPYTHCIDFNTLSEWTKQGNILLINTLPIEHQECLIWGTVDATEEELKINEMYENETEGTNISRIVIYGSNAHDTTVGRKYHQLVQMGFQSVYVYLGGMFEWLLLQDVYGKSEFPTTTENLDLLFYA
jgi:hypothetical protein